MSPFSQHTFTETALLVPNGPVAGPDTVTVGSLLTAKCQELCLSVSEFGEKERNYLFKSYIGSK